jgi:hypothetical protein
MRTQSKTSRDRLGALSRLDSHILKLPASRALTLLAKL